MNEELKYMKGIVSFKLKNSLDNPKAPAGKIKLEGSNTEYVVWSKSKFEELKIGDSVDFEYKVTSKDYNGKMYTSHSITNFKTEEVQKALDNLSPETKAKIKAVEETMEKNQTNAFEDKDFGKKVEKEMEKNLIQFQIGDKVYQGYIWEVK